jgi:lipoprotein-releasing system permease protein
MILIQINNSTLGNHFISPEQEADIKKIEVLRSFKKIIEERVLFVL